MKALFLLGLLAFLKGIAGNVPPTIECPKPSTIIIEQNQNKAALTWVLSDVSAMDQEDGDKLSKILSPVSQQYGSMVGPGKYIISYSVKDKGGLKDYCDFVIDVKRAQCPAIPNIQHGTSTCRQGSTNGQACRIICNKGYEVLGSNSRTCQSNGTYSGSAPMCEGTPFYTRLCSHITQASKGQYNTMVDATLLALQRKLEQIGSLVTGSKGIDRARRYCTDPTLASHGACVFVRRYDLLRLLRGDSAHSEPMYRYLMLTHPEISAFCDEKQSQAKLLETFPDYLRHNNAQYQVLFKTTMELLASNSTAHLRSESKRVCVSKKGTSCLMKDIFALVEHSLLFLTHLQKTKVPGDWTNRDIKYYFNALTFASILLKWNYMKAVEAIRPTANSDQQDVLLKVLMSVAEYVDRGEDDKLRILPTMFPKVVTDKICNNGKMCLFWRVVDQTRMYVVARQPSTANRVKVRILDTNLDTKEFLSQKQMERILQLVADGNYNLLTVAAELKKEFNKTMNKRFVELKAYFKKVQMFNAAKAKSDMIVMKHLREIVEEARGVARYVDKNTFELLIAMITTLGVEAAGQIGKLALHIAEHGNPLKDLLNANPSGIYDAAAGVANALANIAKGGRLVASLRNLKTEALRVNTQFATNRKKIQAMKVLMDGAIAGNKSINFTKAKDDFVKAYKDYYPGLRKDEVVGLESFYSNVIEEACNLIENTATLHAQLGKAYVGGKGLCWKIKVKIAKLFTMYGSIFDKQFELIEVLMQNVQAQVGINAADGILTDYEQVAKAPSDSDDVTQKLKQVAAMSYVSYRLMVLQALRLYCDELQYKMGDNRPLVCNDTYTDLSLLLTFKPPPCTQKLEFQSVPTHRSDKRDTGYLRLKELYEGQEVAFQIPDSKWLYNNGWITRGGANDAIYVQGIELYLPSDLDNQRAIRVEMSVAGRNYLTPGGTWYTLRPDMPRVFSYTLGRSNNCRYPQTLGNPYTTCKTNPLNNVCPQTVYACPVNIGRRPLYPSIFSSFVLRVNGYEDIPFPNTTTPITMRIGVRTCTYSSAGQTTGIQGQFGVVRQQSTQCCVGNKYWSNSLQRCHDCPFNSTVSLNGYYCDKYQAPTTTT